MNKFILVVFLSFTYATSNFSQSISNEKKGPQFSTDAESNNFIGGSVEAKSYIGIKGSPYLNDSLLDGTIYLKDSQLVPGQYRYNIYTDEIECASRDKVFSVKKSERHEYFSFGNTKLVYQSFCYDKEKTKKGYLIVLVEGKYSLYLKKKVVYKPEELDQPYSIPKPNRFEIAEDTYYISYNSNPAIKITSLKSIKKSFPELKTMLENYKEGKNLKKEKNVVNLINFINSNSI